MHPSTILYSILGMRSLISSCRSSIACRSWASIHPISSWYLQSNRCEGCQHTAYTRTIASIMIVWLCTIRPQACSCHVNAGIPRMTLYYLAFEKACSSGACLPMIGNQLCQEGARHANGLQGSNQRALANFITPANEDRSLMRLISTNKPLTIKQVSHLLAAGFCIHSLALPHLPKASTPMLEGYDMHISRPPLAFIKLARDDIPCCLDLVSSPIDVHVYYAYLLYRNEALHRALSCMQTSHSPSWPSYSQAFLPFIPMYFHTYSTLIAVVLTACMRAAGGGA